MSRTYLILLAALGAAPVVAQQARAQGSADSVAADSVAADSATTAQAGTRGGLFGKVKKVAGNKVVQGVAKGVACNALPGAAVAAAAAGSKVCPAGGMLGGGAVNNAVGGAIGGAVGGALGAAADKQGAAATLPDGAVPALGGFMPGAGAVGAMGMGAMASPGAGMKLNEEAAAKCLGLTVQEVRDVMNQAPDAASAARAATVRDKMVKRAQQNAQPADLKACAQMWQQ
jgi:hypothetical protein